MGVMHYVYILVGHLIFLNIADKYKIIFTCSISEQIAYYEI